MRASSTKQLKHPYITVDSKISKGNPIISGTRFRVIDIAIEYDRLGMTPDQIVDAHPHLSLEALHDALSCYYENRGSMDEEIRRRKESIREIAKKASSFLMIRSSF